MEIQCLKRYEAVVKIRRDSGLRVKQECEQLDGLRVVFMASWQIEEDDNRYPGEWAMTPPRNDDRFEIGWIASGDLTDIHELP